MSAYYNEIDPKAAATLRELITCGLIAPGEVDERSIEDVLPAELRGFTQCHFFAGFGIWSYALRLAGWPDDRPVWTGSCPCQPFSQAGKGAGTADERHLWPAFNHLIQYGKRLDVPVYGEQVASPDALAWLDLVQADMEAQSHTVRAFDLCAAGFGAPIIRQRLFWMASAASESNGWGRLFGPGESPCSNNARGASDKSFRDGITERLECAPSDGRQQWRPEPSERSVTSGCGIKRLDCSVQPRLEGLAGDGGSIGLGEIAARSVAASDEPSRMAGTSNARHDRPEATEAEQNCNGQDWGISKRSGDADRWPRATNGFWRDADWLRCRDEQWRPVEPGTFPLAHGYPERMGILRGAGNAISAEVAKAFILATIAS